MAKISATVSTGILSIAKSWEHVSRNFENSPNILRNHTLKLVNLSSSTLSKIILTVINAQIS